MTTQQDRELVRAFLTTAAARGGKLYTPGLEQYAEMLGLSKSALANLIVIYGGPRVTTRTISRWFSGEKTPDDEDTLVALANIFSNTPAGTLERLFERFDPGYITYDDTVEFGRLYLFRNEHGEPELESEAARVNRSRASREAGDAAVIDGSGETDESLSSITSEFDEPADDE